MESADGARQRRRIRGRRLHLEAITGLNEDHHHRRAQQDAQPVSQALHHRRGVGHAIQGVRHFGQNHGPAVLFSRQLLETERFEGRSQLAGQDGRFGGVVLDKLGVGRIAQKGDGSNHFVEHQQGSGHDGLGAELGHQRIALGINPVAEDGSPALDGLERDRRVPGAQLPAAKMVGLVAVGLGAG